MAYEKIKDYGFKEGDKVLVYTVELDGEPATITCINNAGRVVVRYDQDIHHVDIYNDEDHWYSGQLVHPIQCILVE